MELILIIVVLVLLFGGGGGILGSQSRLLVTVRFGQSCVCHTELGALSFAVTAWCTVRKPTKKLIIVSTEESARTSAYPSVDELSRWPVLA